MSKPMCYCSSAAQLESGCRAAHPYGKIGKFWQTSFIGKAETMAEPGSEILGQVEQIVWQYKPAPETIRLPARPGMPEIQIFSIQIKSLRDRSTAAKG